MSTQSDYDSVLLAVSRWPVERRAMLVHALVDGLKNEASAGRPSPRQVVQAATRTLPTADPVPLTQAEKWKEEEMDDRYRRGNRMG